MSRVFVLAAWNKSKAALDRVNGRGIALGTVAGALISAVYNGADALTEYDGLDGEDIVLGAVYGAMCGLIAAMAGTIHPRWKYAEKWAKGGISDTEGAAKLAAKLTAVWTLIKWSIGVGVVCILASTPVLGLIWAIGMLAGGVIAVRSVRL